MTTKVTKSGRKIQPEPKADLNFENICIPGSLF